VDHQIVLSLICAKEVTSIHACFDVDAVDITSERLPEMCAYEAL
jgi:hypothetical protein